MGNKSCLGPHLYHLASLLFLSTIALVALVLLRDVVFSKVHSTESLQNTTLHIR